jgi:hypothetical protein
MKNGKSEIGGENNGEIMKIMKSSMASIMAWQQ